MESNIKLKNRITVLSGIGEKKAAMFSRLGINTVRSLIYYYPRYYEDWQNVSTVLNAPFGEKTTVKVKISGSAVSRPTRSGGTIYTTFGTDGTAILKIIIFNNKYAAEKLTPGDEFILHGVIGGTFSQREMTSPDIKKATDSEGIYPVYGCTKGLNSNAISIAIKKALDKVIPTMEDPLPLTLREKYNLCELTDALKNIHFPESFERLEDARRRLAFEELLILQLGMFRLRNRVRSNDGYIIDKNKVDEFYPLLPFNLTTAQSTAVNEALNDMSSGLVMNRLLEGDVGSGKTAVAAALMFTTAKSGMQCAFMAPTSILASQHFDTLKEIYKNSNIRIELLVGSMPAKAKNDIYHRLKSGEIDILVGTHTLFQKKVEFANLGLVITDEQHRFGVAQRNALTSKGKSPHLLVMTATPIPRTLSLAIFGDLDISILDALPKGRQPIDTYCVTTEYRERIYNFIKKHIAEGRQAYIVCPAVEESEGDLVSAKEYFEVLQKGVFKGYNIGLLHGKMSEKEKNAVMQDFCDNKISLLISTTVVEVGVDVPNSVIMAIENAERFGLSQLHQLRGRVGRGKYKSYCILISDIKSDEAKMRFDVLCNSTDGFKIAEADLKQRGAGDFFGKRQHGLPELKIADLIKDTAIIKESGKAAKDILSDDPLLESEENKYLNILVGRLFNQNGEALN